MGGTVAIMGLMDVPWDPICAIWDNVTGWTVGFQVHYHGTCGRPLCTMGGWTV